MALTKKLEKCVPCTTWKSHLILCKSYQVPITFPHNLLKFVGQNSNGYSRATHYVMSDPKIEKYKFQNRELLPEHDHKQNWLYVISLSSESLTDAIALICTDRSTI